MTKREWDKMCAWIGSHSTYFNSLLGFGCLAIIGQLIMYDALYDGGSIYDPISMFADHGHKWEGKIVGGKYPSMEASILGAVMTVPFVFWSLTLPVNTFLLKLRRRDWFNGDKKPSRRELKVKEREQLADQRERALRKREKELNLPAYELGPIRDTHLSR